MEKRYIVKKNGGFYVTDSRVSLDSIVYSFNEGASPETIRAQFPILTLEEVYGAITSYLQNRKKIDKHLAESEIVFQKEVDFHEKSFIKA